MDASERVEERMNLTFEQTLSKRGVSFLSMKKGGKNLSKNV